MMREFITLIYIIHQFLLQIKEVHRDIYMY